MAERIDLSYVPENVPLSDDVLLYLGQQNDFDTGAGVLSRLVDIDKFVETGILDIGHAALELPGVGVLANRPFAGEKSEQRFLAGLGKSDDSDVHTSDYGGTAGKKQPRAGRHRANETGLPASAGGKDSPAGPIPVMNSVNNRLGTARRTL
jgi:hypothetical protein